MDDKVIQFPGTVMEEVEPREVEVQIENVIEGLINIKDKLDNLIIIGSSNDGHFYFATSSGEAKQIIYDLKSAEHVAMQYGMNLRDDIIPEDMEPRYE